MSGWLDGMDAVVPPPAELAQWARTQASSDAAWAACPRADWAVWLAAAARPTEDEKREIVSAACSLTSTGRGLASRLFHIAPTRSEQARLWAFPDAIDDFDVLLVDWLHGVLLAALVVVPFALWLHSRAADPGAPHTIFMSDLMTIPLAAVTTVVGFLLFRRRRVRIARARSSSLDFAAALAIALSELARAVESKPDSQPLWADLFHQRMAAVYRYRQAK